MIWLIFTFYFCLLFWLGGAHVAYNLFLRNWIIEFCNSFHCLLICPIYLSYSSDLVYRENTLRTATVLNSVIEHFKSGEQSYIDYVRPSLLFNVLIEKTDYLLVCTLQLSIEVTFV